MKLKALQKRIKGGGNASSLSNQDEKTAEISSETCKNSLITSCVEEDGDWGKTDEKQPSDSNITVMYKLNYKQDTACGGDDAVGADLIIPNQEHEYSKILRTFLKDKKNLEKLCEHEYDSQIKNKGINENKRQMISSPKLPVNDKSCINTYPIAKRQDKLVVESSKDFTETNCYHDSLEFHQQLFQNNWNVLLNVYSFCKYESGSLSSNNSNSINDPSSLVSSLSNSEFSSIGSTRSTNVAHTWSTSISYGSVKSNSTSLDEFKMYVDSIGVTANREIIIKGNLSDKIKGGLEKSEAVS